MLRDHINQTQTFDTGRQTFNQHHTIIPHTHGEREKSQTEFVKLS